MAKQPVEFKPKRLSEANVQAEFYMACRRAGMGCFLEYSARWMNPPGRGRFDAVIHKAGEILAIVECKSTRKAKERHIKFPASRQFARYQEAGLPVFLVACMAEIGPTIAELRRVYYSTDAKTQDAAGAM